MIRKCKKCGSEENYNFAINNGLCDSCIGEEFEQLQTERDRLREQILTVAHRARKVSTTIPDVRYFEQFIAEKDRTCPPKESTDGKG